MRVRTPLDKAAGDWMVAKLSTPEGIPVPLLWWFCKLYKGNVKAAVADMNEACGTNYPVRKFREWERGYMKIPEKHRKYIIQEVLRAKFGKALSDCLIDFMDLRFKAPDYADLL